MCKRDIIEDSMKIRNTSNLDNTLMKYFFTEDNKNTLTTIKTSNNDKIISAEKLEKVFKKPIRLRNALKQCYWERNILEV